jgi:uncharacterized protein (DUF697 family)/GTP-binding protein EngB required for normal cell division
LFNDEVAETGAGRPITRDIQLYRSDKVNIYDSEGYEIGGDKQKYYERLIFDDFLDKHKNSQDEDAVHLVWYTINGAGTKITDLDIKLVRRIKEDGFNVCVLITKIDEMDEDQLNNLRTTIEKELIGIDIFKLSTEAKNDPGVAKYCDWEKLIEWSHQHLSDIFKERFVSALRGGLEVKHMQAISAINGYTAMAFAVGVSPIPIGDVVLLYPIQTKMILKILDIYGIKLRNGSISSFEGSNILATVGQTALSLLKLIPFIGTLIGGAINTTVASSLTAALGTALSELCYKQCKDKLDGKPVTLDVEKILSSPEFISVVKSTYEALKNGA